jgi:hypothetical protein
MSLDVRAKPIAPKRSELLGEEQRVHKVDGNAGGNGAAENEIEHDGPHALAAQRA